MTDASTTASPPLSEPAAAPAPTRVLVVDDNRIYREAFRRNLMMAGYDVMEAEDTDEALARVQGVAAAPAGGADAGAPAATGEDAVPSSAEGPGSASAPAPEPPPDVIITDLQMRTETEGIELIKAVKSVDPLLPIIMISAVGTFEEGALAQRHGASAVISKARIEDEIERLYAAIDAARAERQRANVLAQAIEAARAVLSDADADSNPDAIRRAADSLRPILASQDAHPYLRGEAFALTDQLNERTLRAQAAAAAQSLAASGSAAEAAQTSAAAPAAAEVATPAPVTSGAPAAVGTSTFSPLNLASVETVLRRELPAYDTFAEDSKESLRIAEFLYDQQSRLPGSIDFSRNIGFSYCFAVENEAKARMSKRLQRFLASEMTYLLLSELMEKGNQNLSVYFHQHLLLLLRGKDMDFTIDNVRQTFRRILEHQARYKPDGLKALGIMILAFGRNFSFAKEKRNIRIANPLGMKGLDPEKETLHFAESLISLQHYRNPYIHPEISDMEKLSKIRATAFECLNMASRLQ